MQVGMFLGCICVISLCIVGPRTERQIKSLVDYFLQLAIEHINATLSSPGVGPGGQLEVCGRQRRVIGPRNQVGVVGLGVSCDPASLFRLFLLLRQWSRVQTVFLRSGNRRPRFVP